MHWSRKALSVLIDLYESHPVLYNVYDENYHNKAARVAAFDELAKEINNVRPHTTVDNIKMKINTLRSQFSRALGKLKERANGSPAGLKISLWVFERLLFLREYVHVRSYTRRNKDADMQHMNTDRKLPGVFGLDETSSDVASVFDIVKCEYGESSEPQCNAPGTSLFNASQVLDVPFDYSLRPKDISALKPIHMETRTNEIPYTSESEHSETEYSVDCDNDCPQDLSVPKDGLKKHKCDWCGKYFVKPRDLKRHTLTHTGEKPHSCKLCGKSFAQAHSVKLHLMTHTREKPHKCVVCLKTFTQNSDLKRHVLTHGGDNAHTCHVCLKHYTTAENLRQHFMSHTGDKPFQCSQCGKRYTAQYKLKQHALVHTGIKPFKCPVCGKCFTYNNNMKHHAAIHDRESGGLIENVTN